MAKAAISAKLNDMPGQVLTRLVNEQLTSCLAFFASASMVVTLESANKSIFGVCREYALFGGSHQQLLAAAKSCALNTFSAYFGELYPSVISKEVAETYFVTSRESQCHQIANLLLRKVPGLTLARLSSLSSAETAFQLDLRRSSTSSGMTGIMQSPWNAENLIQTAISTGNFEMFYEAFQAANSDGSIDMFDVINQVFDRDDADFLHNLLAHLPQYFTGDLIRPSIFERAFLEGKLNIVRYFHGKGTSNERLISHFKKNSKTGRYSATSLALYSSLANMIGDHSLSIWIINGASRLDASERSTYILSVQFSNAQLWKEIFRLFDFGDGLHMLSVKAASKLFVELVNLQDFKQSLLSKLQIDISDCFEIYLTTRRISDTSFAINAAILLARLRETFGGIESVAEGLRPLAQRRILTETHFGKIARFLMTTARDFAVQFATEFSFNEWLRGTVISTNAMQIFALIQVCRFKNFEFGNILKAKNLTYVRSRQTEHYFKDGEVSLPFSKGQDLALYYSIKYNNPESIIWIVNEFKANINFRNDYFFRLAADLDHMEALNAIVGDLKFSETLTITYIHEMFKNDYNTKILNLASLSAFAENSRLNEVIMPMVLAIRSAENDTTRLPIGELEEQNIGYTPEENSPPLFQTDGSDFDIRNDEGSENLVDLPSSPLHIGFDQMLERLIEEGLLDA